MPKSILAAIVIICAGYVMIPPTTLAVEQTELFGTMLALQSSRGFSGQSNLEDLIFESWLTLRDDDSYDDFLTAYEEQARVSGEYIAETGFAINRDVAGAFSWNVVVPRAGEYDWSLTDATLTAAGSAGITLSAVVQPYSSWGSGQELDRDTCSSIDFAYSDFAAGVPQRWSAYKKFLRAMVERYDGDGVNDMPDLTTRVEAWEIGNEVEGPCGGNLNQASTYVKLLRRSYAVIKKADPDALVLNAGALEIIGHDGNTITETQEFWNDFFDLGGQRYLDVFNIHYNLERTGPNDSMDAWNTHLEFFSELLDTKDIPIWVTEFGTLHGTNAASGEKQTERAQAAWYFRYMITGMSSGIERYFLDFQGDTDSPLTSGALFDEDQQLRRFVKTLQLISEQLEGYSTVEELATGQYKFVVAGQTVYALWDGTAPTAIQQATSVQVYNLAGKAKTVAGVAVEYSSAAPILAIIE